MTIKEYRRLAINLQLFADGGDGGAVGGNAGGEASGVQTGAPYQSSKGVKGNSLENVIYGKQEGTSQDASVVEAEDRVAEFERMIKGDYKDLYDQRVSDTVQKRLKSSKETVERYNALTPTLDLLARKYGVDATDIEALNKAIEDDDTYFEDEALEKGISVEQLKEIRRMERENADLRRQMEEQNIRDNADRIYAGWMEQSEALRSVYPTFDLETEVQNPKFVDLLKNNIDVRTAYEVLHKDEIIPAAMQFTAQTVENKLVNKIRSNGMRPVENGLSGMSSAIVKPDVTMLSKEDRAEIMRRVARGEKIRF